MQRWCMRAFLLLLVGCTIPSKKSNKYINPIWLNTMRDLTKIHEWSWGGMTPTNLYHYLTKATNIKNDSLIGYLSLIDVVIYFAFMFVVIC